MSNCTEMDERALNEDMRNNYTMSLLFSSMILFTILFLQALESAHFSAVPESGIIILIGLLVAAIGFALSDQRLEDLANFPDVVFELVLLPAIIFYSGYSVQKVGIWKNFATINLLAFVGTSISAFLVAIMLVNFTAITDHKEAILFGSLISATDPVATLAIFTEVFGLTEKDYLEAPLVYDVVFGESVLNDAVATVLFQSFASLDFSHVTADTVGLLIWTILWVASVSFIIGAGTGLLSSWLFKASSIRTNSTFDWIIIIVGAYFAYFACASFGASGLFAIFFYGMNTADFGWYNFSSYTQLSAENTLQSIGATSELVVFLVLGSSLMKPSIRASYDIPFTAIVFGIITLARFVAVFLLLGLANIWREQKLKLQEITAVWLSGLRGAIAYTLSLQLVVLGTPEGQKLAAATLLMAAFTTIVQGSLTKPMLYCLGMLNPREPYVHKPNQSPSSVSTRGRSQGGSHNSEIEMQARAGPSAGEAASRSSGDGRHPAPGGHGGFNHVGGKVVDQKEKEEEEDLEPPIVAEQMGLGGRIYHWLSQRVLIFPEDPWKRGEHANRARSVMLSLYVLPLYVTITVDH